MLGTIIEAGVLLLAHATLWFLVSLVAARNDVADVAWGLGGVLLVGWFALSRPVDALDVGVYLPVAAWGLRLSVHLLLRMRGRGEDFRYREWREEWGGAFLVRSYLQVYLLQGVLLTVVLLPVCAAAASGPASLDAAAFLGLAVWAAGFGFEAIADWQLLRFRRRGEGRVLTDGLWRWSRHPNYFGEVVLWWGLALVTLPAEHGLWALASPVTVTVLILLVSGIPMLEAKYEGDPDYEAYRERTSAFLPRPPRSPR